MNTTSGALFPGAGLLSLPEAIAFANADSSGNAKISFDPKVFSAPQTITLTGTQLELSNTTEPETITGPAAGVTISGGGLSRVFQVDAGVTASISGLTIIGGSPPAKAGGLYDLGSATLTDCTVSGNSGFNGGGLFNAGGVTATLTDCTVSGNSASNSGGGVYTFRRHDHADRLHGQRQLRLRRRRPGQLRRHDHADRLHRQRQLPASTAAGCAISRHDHADRLHHQRQHSSSIGGGVDNYNGARGATNCTVSGNTAAGDGGGLATTPRRH